MCIFVKIELISNTGIFYNNLHLKCIILTTKHTMAIDEHAILQRFSPDSLHISLNCSPFPYGLFLMSSTTVNHFIALSSICCKTTDNESFSSLNSSSLVSESPILKLKRTTYGVMFVIFCLELNSLHWIRHLDFVLQLLLCCSYNATKI